MRIAVFSTKPYDRVFLQEANRAHSHELVFFEPRLTAETAVLAHGFPAVCAFVNDDLVAPVLEELHQNGTRIVVLRSAGFNNVDLNTASRLGITVARVPAYSPHAVAEHALGLILTLNRRFHRAFNRVREGNFSLDGLIGFDLHGRTVGVVGTGNIGAIFCRIMVGIGCRVIAADPYPNDECVEMGVRYVELEELLRESDIIVLHCPLTPETYRLIDEDAIRAMKPGVMLINTSRGALIDTQAVIEGLKRRRIGYLGLDVYEEEADLFFEDLSGTVITDDVFARLLTFPNVVITGHQGFLTEEALRNIATTTLSNATAFETGSGELHEVSLERVS
jgi:D-lactate dehydrogenase